MRRAARSWHVGSDFDRSATTRLPLDSKATLIGTQVLTLLFSRLFSYICFFLFSCPKKRYLYKKIESKSCLSICYAFTWNFGIKILLFLYSWGWTWAKKIKQSLNVFAVKSLPRSPCVKAKQLKLLELWRSWQWLEGSPTYWGGGNQWTICK